MGTRTVVTKPKPEKATAYLAATITDTDEVTPLPNADSVLTHLTMTLYEKVSGTLINSCLARSILNTGGGTVSSAAALSVRLDAPDMACVKTTDSEQHIALIQWDWGSPKKDGKHEIEFTVSNLLKVT